MRRFAGIGMLLLALAGCQSLPAIVRIEVDGSTLEFKKKVPEPEPETVPEAPEANGAGDVPAR
jgi:hypothetical protein